MRDGSVCDGSKIVASDFNALFYMEKIKRLEEELAAKNEIKYQTDKIAQQLQ